MRRLRRLAGLLLPALALSATLYGVQVEPFLNVAAGPWGVGGEIGVLIDGDR